MRKTLAANEVITFDTLGTRVNLALLEGDILFKTESAITGAEDEEAYVLNESVRTVSVFTANLGNKAFYIKAGAAGAKIQYRME